MKYTNNQIKIVGAQSSINSNRKQSFLIVFFIFRYLLLTLKWLQIIRKIKQPTNKKVKKKTKKYAFMKRENTKNQNLKKSKKKRYQRNWKRKLLNL